MEDERDEQTADELIKYGKKNNPKSKSQNQDDDYYAGKLDGEALAKGKFIYFLFGLLVGLLAIIITVFYREAVHLDYYEGKSNAYKAGFIEAYQNKSRNNNVVLTVVGCIFNFVLIYILYGFWL